MWPTVVALLGSLRSARHRTPPRARAGLDMSLRVVARFAGQDLAERTARQMDYAGGSGPDVSRPVNPAHGTTNTPGAMALWPSKLVRTKA